MMILKPIAIVGIMGAGKTLIAKKIGKQLDLNVIDLDEQIAHHLTQPIKTMFNSEKKSEFQEIEFKVLKQHIDSKNIISTGDTLIYNQKAWNYLLQNTLSIWLNPSLRAIFPRLRESPNRPFFHPDFTLQEFNTLLKGRIKRYKNAHIELKRINFKTLHDVLGLLKPKRQSEALAGDSEEHS